MGLYLVQHGKSLSKDINPDQGRADIRRIAEVAKHYMLFLCLKSGTASNQEPARLLKFFVIYWMCLAGSLKWMD